MKIKANVLHATDSCTSPITMCGSRTAKFAQLTVSAYCVSAGDSLDKKIACERYRSVTCPECIKQLRYALADAARCTGSWGRTAKRLQSALRMSKVEPVVVLKRHRNASCHWTGVCTDSNAFARLVKQASR
jgi:hypothetical protein